MEELGYSNGLEDLVESSGEKPDGPNRLTTRVRKTFRVLGLHMVKSAPPAILSNPVYALKEVFLDGLSTRESLAARLIYNSFNSMGIGRIYMKQRARFYDFLNIVSGDSGFKKMSVDAIFTTLFSFVPYSAIYLGESLFSCFENFHWASFYSQVVSAAVLSGGLAFTNGYIADTFSFFAGIAEQKRWLPKVMVDAPNRVKRCLAVGMAAGMIAGTIGSYVLKDYFKPLNNHYEKRVM